MDSTLVLLDVGVVRFIVCCGVFFLSFSFFVFYLEKIISFVQLKH